MNCMVLYCIIFYYICILLYCIVFYYISSRKRSKLESIFRRNKLSKENEDIYEEQCKLVNNLLTSSKCSYFRTTISSYKDCPKKLWNTLNSLLGRNVPKSLPSAVSPSALATSFLNFFNDKVTKLCAKIPKIGRA